MGPIHYPALVNLYRLTGNQKKKIILWIDL